MTSAIEKVAAHEKECAIRYENIEKRLDQGQTRFAIRKYDMGSLCINDNF